MENAFHLIINAKFKVIVEKNRNATMESVLINAWVSNVLVNNVNKANVFLESVKKMNNVQKDLSVKMKYVLLIFNYVLLVLNIKLTHALNLGQMIKTALSL